MSHGEPNYNRDATKKPCAPEVPITSNTRPKPCNNELHVRGVHAVAEGRDHREIEDAKGHVELVLLELLAARNGVELD